MLLPCLFAIIPCSQSCYCCTIFVHENILMKHCLLNLKLSHIFLLVSMLMCTPCCSYFFMLEPSFSLKQNTMLFLSFCTWSLIFTSLHLEPWVVRYLDLKLEKMSYVLHVFWICCMGICFVSCRQHVSASRPSDPCVSLSPPSSQFCLLVAF